LISNFPLVKIENYKQLKELTTNKVKNKLMKKRDLVLYYV